MNCACSRPLLHDIVVIQADQKAPSRTQWPRRTESRRLPWAQVTGQAWNGLCREQLRFRSLEVGSLGIVVCFACCDIGLGPTSEALRLMSLFPLRDVHI